MVIDNANNWMIQIDKKLKMMMIEVYVYSIS